MYIYEISGIGFVGLFLHRDQLETEIDTFLRKDLNPYIITIDDGQIHHVRELQKNEYKGEFQDQKTGRKYMKLSVNGVHCKVYFDTFYSFPYEEIIRLRNEDKEVCSDLMLSCFLKQTEKVAAIVPLRTKDTIICGWASTSSDKYQNVLCIPTEDGHYKKESWYYKMTFSPLQPQMRFFASTMETYTSDICSLINSGNIKLVNKEEYIEKLNTAMAAKVKVLRSKNPFKRKKKDLEVVQIPAFTTDGIVGISAVKTNFLEEEIACILADNVTATA